MYKSKIASANTLSVSVSFLTKLTEPSFLSLSTVIFALRISVSPSTPITNGYCLASPVSSNSIENPAGAFVSTK